MRAIRFVTTSCCQPGVLSPSGLILTHNTIPLKASFFLSRILITTSINNSGCRSFAVLTLIYTLLGIAGGWFLWQWRELEARQWVLLAALMIFLRIGFFATMENPEPRYVVEVFPFLSILGGIALVRIKRLMKTTTNNGGFLVTPLRGWRREKFFFFFRAFFFPLIRFCGRRIHFTSNQRNIPVRSQTKSDRRHKTRTIPSNN